MVKVLRKTPFLGVGMDESTDRSSEKHVIFVIHYLDGDAVRTSFLPIEKVTDGKAKTLCDCLTSVLFCSSQHFTGLEWWWWLIVTLMVSSFRDSYLGINKRKAFERGERAHSQNSANPIWHSLPFQPIRLHFPVRHCFAMTINKSGWNILRGGPQPQHPSIHPRNALRPLLESWETDVKFFPEHS